MFVFVTEFYVLSLTSKQNDALRTILYQKYTKLVSMRWEKSLSFSMTSKLNNRLLLSRHLFAIMIYLVILFRVTNRLARFDALAGFIGARKHA